MKRQHVDWSVPQRQSWAALFIILYKMLLRILRIFWPLLLYYIFKNKANRFDVLEAMIVGLSVISLLGSVLEFLYFRFFIQGDDLIIKKGFITKNTISLPLDKIQAVHIEQTWLHSLLNASRVSFDSAGSESIEVKIDAINKAEAEGFKRFILDTKPQSSSEELIPVQEDVIIRLSGADLVRLSISANHLEAFVLMLAFFVSAFEQLKDIFNLEYMRFISWVYQFGDSKGAVLLSGIILALMVSVIISTARIVFRYFNFTISSSRKGYSIHSGLVNIQEKLVPFKKIQFISWRANWIRKQMGLFLLHFHAIGSDEVNEKMRVKVPITNDDMIPVLLQQYHPLLPTGTLTALRIHNAFIGRRMLLSGLLPAAIIGAGLFFYFGWNVLWLSVWIIWSGISAWLFQKKFRLWTDHRALQIKRGALGREELVLRWDMIQSVAVQQSIYQEGRRLATVKLYTAGGTVTIPYIQLHQARAIANYALYMVEARSK
ncbi:MAG TPA: PH domain-containing protein [Chitinophagaceae bacterium]|nr:PH domain-containing protein [Chitinophagaceae bacterium]